MIWSLPPVGNLNVERPLLCTARDYFIRLLRFLLAAVLDLDAPGLGISAVGFTLPSSRTASRSDSGMWMLLPGRGIS